MTESEYLAELNPQLALIKALYAKIDHLQNTLDVVVRVLKGDK